MPDAAPLLDALAFAADRHRDQRRKGADAAPYINHPIEVARLLAVIGGVNDVDVLRAALLHDTVEDTDATPGEITVRFGRRVSALVMEVTDDKSLPKAERKRLQIEHAASLSADAKAIKLADKIANVRDVAERPPRDWSVERRREYFDWTEAVVAGCRGANAALEREYDAVLVRGRERLAQEVAGARDYRDRDEARHGPKPRVTESYPLGHDWRARFPDAELYRASEGGAVYVADDADGHHVITDESTMADMLGEDDMDAIAIHTFDSAQARAAWVLQRYPRRPSPRHDRG